jgi:two-component system sensor histidine kinase CiaH
VLTDPVSVRGRQLFVQIVGDRTTEERTLRILVLVLVVGGAIALLVASGVGAAYASRALVPIRRSLANQREALRRQREFAADASHELRTPLTVIRASVEDLERHPRKTVSTVGSALTDIRDEVDHLTSMVDDLLLLARSDSGAVELERVPLDLGDVASTGASALTRLASERDVRLVVDPIPAEVSGDPARLRQLVGILVDNAIRHAPAGSRVDVRVRTDGNDAVLVVEDEGPGIRPEDLPRVFDRFYRAAGAPGGGTGLGLAIAAWIVERHGGRIAAANRESAGARFTVRLPLASRN